MSKSFFAQAGRAGPNDLGQRVPELAPLRKATVAVFGLGCLGGPSVMEFARCGMKELRLVDCDIVDPGTICRWPFGMHAIGLPKAVALCDAIARDYPFTGATGFIHYLGAVRNSGDSREPEQSVMRKITDGASLVYDATAEVGIQQYLSDYAAAIGVPYIGVDATPGGWGGRIVRIMPCSPAGCWMCYQQALESGDIAEPPSLADDGVQPAGCAEPTFTGASFDMWQISLAAVRLAVSTLCAHEPNGYPATEWEVMTISLRDSKGGLIAPTFRPHRLEKHPKCYRCSST